MTSEVALPCWNEAHSTQSEATIRVAGYANDTVMYGRDPSEIPAVICILEDFAQASGLPVKLKKLVSLPLNTLAHFNPSTACGMEVLPRDDMCRYLGVLVGQQVMITASF